MTELTIVIPTQGRSTLRDVLYSLAPAQHGGFRSQVLVVADTHSPLLMDVEAACREYGASYLEHDAGYHDWGYCLPADAVVEAPGLMAASRRRYHGPMLEILLGSGRLTITPEHPVLTERGWVPAGQLHEGDHLIRARFDERRLRGKPDVERKPSQIVELFYALYEQRANSRMLQLGMQLDGDRSDGEVNVVAADSLLRDDTTHAASLEPAEHLALTLPYLLTRFGLTTHSATHERLLAGAVAKSSRLAGLDEPLHRFRIVQIPQLLDFTIGPEANASIDEPIFAGAVRYVEAPSDRTDRLPRFIAPDKIRDIRRFTHDGHVYDLQTRSGWYLADGLIVHNCQLRYGYERASGAYIMNCGDDDTYVPGALPAIAAALDEAGEGPVMFRAEMHPSPNRGHRGPPMLVWTERLLAEGIITGQNLATPNVPGRIGGWANDWKHALETVALWGGLCHWREEVIVRCY